MKKWEENWEAPCQCGHEHFEYVDESFWAFSWVCPVANCPCLNFKRKEKL